MIRPFKASLAFSIKQKYYRQSAVSFLLVSPAFSPFFLCISILTQSLASIDGCSSEITLREECRRLERVPVLSGKGIDGSLLGSASLGKLLILANTVRKRRRIESVSAYPPRSCSATIRTPWSMCDGQKVKAGAHTQ